MRREQRRPRQLVIDASVGRAAGGEDATHPIPKNCRDFLRKVLDVCHHIVLSSPIGDEWDIHASTSRFTRKWLLAMEGEKKIDRPAVPQDSSIRQKTRRISGSEEEWGQVRKDLPLLEAARATDRVIASRDEKARRRFARFANAVTELRNVTWVNPENLAEEDLIEWLGRGAPNERHRSLGHSGR